MRRRRASSRGFWTVRFGLIAALVFVVLACGLYALSYRPSPDAIVYGVSFSPLRAEALGLDWKETYLAVLDDLGARRFRLGAYWPLVEPVEGAYDFTALDYQVNEASTRNASIILAVGRRLPGWPECHEPAWAAEKTWGERKAALRAYLVAVVERYRGSNAIVMWQIENEPFLSLFAGEQCGSLDSAFLDEEIALVKSLDPSRSVLVTDSGNLGTWASAYRRGDSFGTSVYLYFWNPELGQFRTALPPEFYRLKANLARLIFGEKPVLLIELSLEPWLTQPTVQVPLETQLSRMSEATFDEVLAYARETRLPEQYLWGAEWWYYMKSRGHGEFWQKARPLLSGAVQ